MTVFAHQYLCRLILLATFALSFSSGGAMAADSPGPAQALAGNATQVAAARAEVFRANPQLLQSIMRGGSFSGDDFSMEIANHMYSRTDAKAIADARRMLKIEPEGPRTWLLRFPFVNVTVFETDAGLVLVDSGYAPAGPALADALKKLSDKPVNTIILTHHHPDHAPGAWALMQGAHPPRVVTTDLFVREMERDFLTYGELARNDQQVVVPHGWADVVRPTQTFHDKLTLHIGGEDFVLTSADGETEGQLWVWVPGRRIVVSADYFQGGFLPNAGNGKRRQRYPLDWAKALHAMAAMHPARVLPGHGPALTDEAQIQARLTAQAEMLESLTRQVLDGLNRGERKDLIIDHTALPPALARLDDARLLYDKPRDIAAMAVREYSGWWNDIPSDYAPAPLAEQAHELAALAGGVDKLIARAQALAADNPALACNLADWAWLAAPDDAAVLRGSLAVYGERVKTPLPAQDALVYAEHMVKLRLQLDRSSQPAK